MTKAVSRGKNTQPIVHVLYARQPGVVLARPLERHLQTPERLRARSVESGKDHRAVRAD
jgi:hypothetical protein